MNYFFNTEWLYVNWSKKWTCGAWGTKHVDKPPPSDWLGLQNGASLLCVDAGGRERDNAVKKRAKEGASLSDHHELHRLLAGISSATASHYPFLFHSLPLHTNVSLTERAWEAEPWTCEGLSSSTPHPYLSDRRCLGNLPPATIVGWRILEPIWKLENRMLPMPTILDASSFSILTRPKSPWV